MAVIEWVITIAIVLTAFFFVIRSFYRSSAGKDSPCAGCTSAACSSKKRRQVDSADKATTSSNE